MIILVLSFLTLFSLAPTHPANAPPATQPNRERVLKACATEFGPAIDGQDNLFEVSRYYVLQASFDNSGLLTQLGVLPKHLFADKHPEWNETDDVGELTWAEYSKLLWRLEGIQPKGHLLQSAKWPVVKDTVATWRDTYSNAVLVTSDVVRTRNVVTFNRTSDRSIKYFVVYFTPRMVASIVSPGLSPTKSLPPGELGR